nr:universal stress protein [Brevibacterium sp. UCMA 11754]
MSQLRFSARSRRRSAAGTLNDLVTEHDAQLIVIGLRKRSAIGKFILGSQAQRILLEAKKSRSSPPRPEPRRHPPGSGPLIGQPRQLPGGPPPLTGGPAAYRVGRGPSPRSSSGSDTPCASLRSAI